MTETLALAAVAGLITTVFGFAVLEAAARDRRRLEAKAGIVRVSRPTRAISPLALLVALGAIVAGPRVALLAGGEMPQPRFVTPAELAVFRAAWRGLAIVLGALVILAALAAREPAWLLALVPTPFVARILVVGRARALDRARAQSLERELTVALDIFVLALEAGLPFERAVTAYVETTQSVLAQELAVTVRELEVGYRRREALERLVHRTRSAGLAAMASAVRLAEEFGTPLAAALRSLTVDLRAQRRNRLQEAALRAPVTMLVPTAGLILLPIFAIILGPIALRVATGTLF